MEEEQRNTGVEETQEDTNAGVGVEQEQVVAGEDDSTPAAKVDEGAAALENLVTELEKRLESEEELRREGEEKLSGVQKSLAQAVSRYRSNLLAEMPEAPESMVHGQTVDEVDESFAKAKELVERVRRGVEERMAQGRLPAGSPARSGADFSSLSPLEKIRSALSRG